MLESDQELSAYHRKLNKQVPLSFILFVVISMLVQVTRIMVGIFRLEGEYLRAMLPVWVLEDLFMTAVSIYALYLRKFATRPEHRENTASQLSVRFRLHICRLIPNLFSCIYIYRATFLKDSAFPLVWLMGFLTQYFACNALMDTLLWKVGSMLALNLGMVVSAYFSGDIKESFAKHIILPVAIVAFIFALQGRGDFESFVLKRLLKAQKRVYEGFLQKQKDPAIILDRDRVLFLNEAAQLEIGITSDNFYRKAGNMFSLAGCSLEECIRNKLSRTNVDGGDLVKQEKFFMHDENSDLIEWERVLMVTLIETTFSSNKKTISIVLHDLTKEITIEEQRIEAHYKNIMLFSLSHELRTPLNILQDAIWIYKKYSLTPDDHLQINSAKGAWRYLRNKISDTLDYSQIMTGEFSLHLSRFSLGKFVQYLRKTTLFLLRQKSATIDLQFTVDDKLRDRIEADKERLEQVLFNLINNAIKYTTSGTVSLNVVWNPQKPEMVNFEVADTGCGMAEDMMQALLKSSLALIDRHKTPEDPATTTGATPSSSAKKKSAGLGLTVSRMICQKMGSDLKIASVLGKGSAFLFSVQAGPAGKQAEGDDSVPDECKARERRSFIAPCGSGGVLSTPGAKSCALIKAHVEEIVVVVVDDNEMNRVIVCRMVGKYGFRIVQAENGLVAVNKYKEIGKKGKTVILMDLDMPVMDGIDATKEIRKLGNGQRPYICALTAYASEQERRRALEAGMDDFLSKPLTKDNLVELLRKLSLIF